MNHWKLLTVCAVAALFTAATAFGAGTAAKITVSQSADKVTISGGVGKKIASDKFALSKDAWYVIKIAYTGPQVSVCQLSLVTQDLIDKKQTVSGLLTNWMGPNTTEQIKHTGIMKSADYMIYVDSAGGPWTIEILKSPKPTTVSSDSTFKGTSDKVTPFFRLKKGSAEFTMHQSQKGKGIFATRLEVDLVDADSGELVTYLCHNSTEATQTATADIKADGSYVLAVSGASNWDVSFKQ